MVLLLVSHRYLDSVFDQESHHLHETLEVEHYLSVLIENIVIFA